MSSNNGAIYYRPPARFKHLFPQGWVRLGDTVAAVHRTFAELPIHNTGKILTIQDLQDRYEVEVIPLKAPGTQRNDRRSLEDIRNTFGSFKVNQIKPQHVYQFYSAVEKVKGARTARMDIEVLRHMYSKAVEWGVIDSHPFIGMVRLPKSPPRSRYVTDAELDAFREMVPTKIKAYIDLKLFTGLSKQDLLLIELSNIQEDGLHARRRKTQAKPKVYQWDDQGILKDAIRSIKKAHRQHVGSRYLFHTRAGKPYYRSEWRKNSDPGKNLREILLNQQDH